MAKPRPARQAEMGQALGIERRAWVRYPTDRDVFCQPETGRKDHDRWWQAQVRDISAGGIGLVLNHCFAPGTILSVELPNTKQSPVILQLARVVHAAAQADGRWVIGCEFATRLRDDDLQALTGAGPTTPPAPAETPGGTGKPDGGPKHAAIATQQRLGRPDTP